MMHMIKDMVSGFARHLIGRPIETLAESSNYKVFEQWAGIILVVLLWTIDAEMLRHFMIAPETC